MVGAKIPQSAVAAQERRYPRLRTDLTARVIRSNPTYAGSAQRLRQTTYIIEVTRTRIFSARPHYPCTEDKMRHAATGIPRWSWRAVAVALCFAAQGVGAGPVGAQARPSIQDGDRIRVTAPSLGMAEAECDVARVDEAEAQVYCDGGRVLTGLPWNSIERLDVSVEKKGRAVVGGVLGFAAGAAVGAIVATAATDEDDWLFSTEDVMGPAIVGFGLAGGIVGALIGNSLKRDVWTPAPRPGPAVAVEGGPARGGWGLGVRVTF